ncbi:MAG: hypothetical protein A2255_03295 [Candidatus Melainabacteria bacterium RIFOXYA2_FULL_32_9]|nr:MAG: hypothetical protein A2255_03295 [Candidatus Melainabacteria bacterium RIFOXYA2_FULL_32_9]
MAMDGALIPAKGIWVSWDGANKVVSEQDRTYDVNTGYKVAHFSMDPDKMNTFYGKVSNCLLWPTSHDLPQYASEVSDDEWNTYKDVNKTFAQKTVQQLDKTGKGNVIWVQDYQLMMTPGFIRDEINKKDEFNSKDKKASLGYFHHIPFPEPKVFLSGLGKERAAEIVKSLLKSDMIGFHIPMYVNNFAKTVNVLKSEGLLPEVKGIKDEGKSKIISYKDEATGVERKVKVQDFPISIDYEDCKKISQKPETDKAMESIQEQIKSKNPNHEYLVFGIDRSDYTKGIPERIEAINKFLASTPKEDREKVTFTLAIAPSRGSIPQFARLHEEVMEAVENVNKKYGNENYTPIIHLGNLSPAEKAGYMRLANSMIVNPVADGMNLVAKEMVAHKLPNDPPCQLVLTRTAGIAHDPDFAKNSLVIDDPKDTDKIAGLIGQAINNIKNDPEAVEKQTKELNESVKHNNIGKWTVDYLKDLKSFVGNDK